VTAEAAGSGLRRSGTVVFQRLRSHAVRRISWGLSDQAVSSLTNAAVSIYIARTLGAEKFGAFSLAYMTYAFALNASRGLATDPLMVRFSVTDLPTWRRAVARCTGTAAIVGLIIGVFVLAAAAVIGGTTGQAFLALGLTLPGLMLQDSWRYSFLALGRGSQAFLNDTIWAAAMLPALILLRATGHANVFWFVLAWGATAAVAAAVGPLQARIIPKLSGAWEWVSDHRDLGPRYLAEGALSASVLQLRGYGVGLVLGLAAVGYVQAAATLMGPITILFLGMTLVAIPEAARVLQRAPGRLPLFCVLVSAGLCTAALGWGVFVLIALPKGFGAWLLGSLWRPTYPLVLPQMLFVIGQGVQGGAAVGLHALGSARRSLRTVILGMVIYLVCSLAGAVWDGATGTVRGAAVAAWLGALLTWWQLRAALRESSHVAAGHQISSGRPAGRHHAAAVPHSSRPPGSG
jgi:O-antigen/teichoic acid export membrane protein